MIYADTRFLKVAWDESLRSACVEWKDTYVDGEEYRTALDKVLDLLELKKSNRLLGDGRRMKVISVADQAWVEASWLPRSAQVGLRYSALLLPKSALALLSVDRIVTKYKLSDAASAEVVSAYFDDIERAKAWLRTQPK
jgi:hypothetical protein